MYRISFMKMVFTDLKNNRFIIYPVLKGYVIQNMCIYFVFKTYFYTKKSYGNYTHTHKTQRYM